MNQGLRIKNRNSGFTLVELMVAISIVAVLAAIGFTLFQTTQSSARDAKRRADMDSVATALETRFDASASTYPAALSADWFSDRSVPVDSLNTGDYIYSVVIPAAADSYTACARLEKGGGNFSDQGTTAASGESAIYYCKRSQQQ